MGIPTLISTTTASSVTNVTITSGIDSTYDEYMFVFTDISHASAGSALTFQVNADGASGYDETVTTTHFEADHLEDDSRARVIYEAGSDLAQSTNPVILAQDSDDATASSFAGILHIFSPSNTTYVTHFYSRMSGRYNALAATDENTAGYFNLTAAIDEIKFFSSSGNFSGVIQMYGIA